LEEKDDLVTEWVTKVFVEQAMLHRVCKQLWTCLDLWIWIESNTWHNIMQMGENQRRGTIGICEESVEFVTERCCVAYRFSKLVICNFVGQVRCRVIIKFPVVFYIMGSRLDTPSTVFWQMNWKLSWRKSSVKTYIRGGGHNGLVLGALMSFADYIWEQLQDHDLCILDLGIGHFGQTR
jgi:hypothetical protein